MGLLNYLGGRGSSAGEEGSSRHFESDVGGVTVGGVALEEEKSWEQPDPSVDNVPFTSFDDVHVDDARRRSSRLRSTLTALLIWAVMVLAVRALALATFVYITRFNVEDRATKI